MKVLTHEEFKALAAAQGGEKVNYKFRCPSCKTVQSGQDLIDAGAGESFEDIQQYLAFSCVGRFSKDKGCDWTLGGLFQIHTMEVVTADGTHHPVFEPINA